MRVALRRGHRALKQVWMWGLRPGPRAALPPLQSRSRDPRAAWKGRRPAGALLDPEVTAWPAGRRGGRRCSRTPSTEIPAKFFFDVKLIAPVTLRLGGP